MHAERMLGDVQRIHAEMTEAADGKDLWVVGGGELVGQVLYTAALVDAPLRVVEVLVLSPIGVRADLQGQGIGSALMRRSLAALADLEMD